MIGRLIALAACAASCYNPPEPDCGFVCGPSNACPADYTCAADRHCHRNGSPASLVCGTPDAAVPDTPAAPQVLATQPANNMTGVAVDVVPTAVIDQRIEQRIEVFSPTDITLMAGTTQVAGTGNLSADSMSIQFFPELQLAANTQFTVTIDANVLATGGVVGPYSWSFTTGADNIAPHASAVAPVAGATGVSTTATISVGFDEPVLAVDTTSFTITDGVTPVVGTIAASGATGYVFTPTAPLTAGTTYTVDLSPAIHDAAGNALADFSYTFTTQ